jgi:hypothetical protein
VGDVRSLSSSACLLWTVLTARAHFTQFGAFSAIWVAARRRISGLIARGSVCVDGGRLSGEITGWLKTVARAARGLNKVMTLPAVRDLRSAHRLVLQARRHVSARRRAGGRCKPGPGNLVRACIDCLVEAPH